MAVHVKGSPFTARRNWVEKTHGEDGLKRLLEQVQPDTHTLLSGPILNGAWYPFDCFVDINASVGRVFGDGDEALIRELARYAADANLKTIYKIFYKVGSVKWILDRAAKLWRMNYDSGELLVHNDEGNNVELEILDFGTPHRVHCLAVLGWAERSVELSGGTNVVANMPECRGSQNPRCLLQISWD